MKSRPLAPTMGLVMCMLWDARGSVVEVDAIVDRLYGDDEDGGPLHAEGNVYVAVCFLRELGVEIETVTTYRCLDRFPAVTAPQHRAVLAAMAADRTRSDIGATLGLRPEVVSVAISKMRGQGVRIESVAGYRLRIASYDRISDPPDQQDQLAA